MADTDAVGTLSPRRAAVAEAEAVADLWLLSRRRAAPFIPPPVQNDDDVRAWFSGVVLTSREVWVIGAAGDLLALMVLDEEWLDQLYVHPDHSGKGFGSCLVNLAKRLRPSGLGLWTFQSNHGARRFYERHGFHAVETTDGANEEASPDICYRWCSTAAKSTG
ncbi:MAG: GNAT family N-acetyltransferase [Acidimicrobiales bacterium]